MSVMDAFGYTFLGAGIVVMLFWSVWVCVFFYKEIRKELR